MYAQILRDLAHRGNGRLALASIRLGALHLSDLLTPWSRSILLAHPSSCATYYRSLPDLTRLAAVLFSRATERGLGDITRTNDPADNTGIARNRDHLFINWLICFAG